METECI